jgi:hypothetical protein
MRRDRAVKGLAEGGQSGETFERRGGRDVVAIGRIEAEMAGRLMLVSVVLPIQPYCAALEFYCLKSLPFLFASRLHPGAHFSPVTEQYLPETLIHSEPFIACPVSSLVLILPLLFSHVPLYLPVYYHLLDLYFLLYCFY